MAERLSGKVAIVTGSARGIGAAIAAAMVAEGAAVLFSDVRDDLGREAAARAARDGAAEYTHLDVTSDGDWDRAMEVCEERFGSPTVLVNNAFVSTFLPLLDESPEGWARTLDVVLGGAYLGMCKVIPAMSEAGGGSIVNIGSTSGIVGVPGDAAYQAAKGGLRVLTKNVAVTYAAQGIRANCLHPGAVLTPVVAEANAEEHQQAVVVRTPAGRAAVPEEIAPAAVFLASDESSYMTGSDLVVDGGLTAI
jgi:NAD(P)-dependent dehydrogenase (short-subunit alcohol dehydrogenase family)